ncbi:hypothetical protein PQR75_06545 [Paraburkholderia fungorum]|uniref:hypothetical protein n=1 Tax=Paraburkholderia fungorum TaxID=134537 RepID=UPI0038B94F1D
MTRALQHQCLTENKLAYSRLKTQILEAAATLDGMKESEQDAPPSLQETNRDELKAALENAFAKADSLFGERLGMLLVLLPDSDELNTQVEKYVTKHCTTKPVTLGMQAMTKELQKKRETAQQEARANQPQGEGGLSDEARSKLHDQQREQRGHSAHHTNGQLYT